MFFSGPVESTGSLILMHYFLGDYPYIFACMKKDNCVATVQHLLVLEMANMGVKINKYVAFNWLDSLVKMRAKTIWLDIYVLFSNFLYKIKIDGLARGLTFKVYCLGFMNVYLHTQLQPLSHKQICIATVQQLLFKLLE